MGCEHCNKAAAAGTWPPPRRVALRDTTLFLHICDFCGTYWEHAEQKLCALSDDDARKQYPTYFRSQSGRRRRDALDLDSILVEDDDDANAG